MAFPSPSAIFFYLFMNLSEMRFPRQLESLWTPDAISEALTGRTAKLWQGGELSVPVLALSEPLAKTLHRNMLKKRILWGFESASERLKNEKAGIENARRIGAPMHHGSRVSRLILLSNDGAERLYRHAEQLIKSHWPRLLVCMLQADSLLLGKTVTGKDRQIKLVMAEHKDTVSEMLQAVIEAGKTGV